LVLAVASPTEAAIGDLLAGRYRLEQLLSENAGIQLWRGSDNFAGGLAVAIRGWSGLSEARLVLLRQRLERLQRVLHPQVPRLGALISVEAGLWQVREWVNGRTYRELLLSRQERQLVFGAGEVLLLLRQLLPALAALHGEDLIHGDLTPANLLRRENDGLPVLIDFGLQGAPGEEPLLTATPGYAPVAQGRESPAAWMDLYSLGVTALVLLSGEKPAALLDPQTMEWRWPDGLEVDPLFRVLLERMLSSDPERRFSAVAQLIEPLAALPVPDSTGPVGRSDRTAVLMPVRASKPIEADSQPIEKPKPLEKAEPSEKTEPKPEPQLPTTAAPRILRRVNRQQRQLEKERAAEGRFWPVVLVLVLTALLGSALGWILLGRNRQGATPLQNLPGSVSLPPAEVDQRQQLLNRLKALQVDRDWFLRLVDRGLAAQFPERGGKPPSDSLEDAPLRKIWNDLAQDWLVRVEQLPVVLRSRLGSFKSGDWQARQANLTAQGLSPQVLQQLVSSSAQNLLPGRNPETVPDEPFRQLWYAAALRSLEGLKVEQLEPTPNLARSLSAVVDGQGARLFAIKIQPGFKLVLGVNGTNLMQMTVFAANGQVLDPRGPLRVVTVPKVEGSLVQVLVRNDGMAAGMISLSVRVDPPLAAPPANIQIPLPASPGGVAVPPPVAPNPPPNPATPGVQESSEPLQR
jgi:serine/threonine-protein kinase